MYIISNMAEDKFVKRNNGKDGKFLLTSKKAQAYTFANRSKASNVLTNNCTKLRKTVNLKVLEIPEDKPKKSKKSKKIEPHMIDYIEKYGEKEIKDIPNSNSDIYQILEFLQTFPKDLEKEKAFIEMQLTHICRGITDTYHYRRYKPLRTNEERCKLDILETELQCKRRDLKRELELIDFTQKNYAKPNFIKLLQEYMEKQKTYHPREFGELFEKDEVPDFKEWFAKYEIRRDFIPMTFEDYYKEWMEKEYALTVKEKSAIRLNREYKRVYSGNAFSKKPLKEISDKDCENFLQETEQKYGSIQKTRFILKNVLRYATEKEMSDENK